MTTAVGRICASFGIEIVGLIGNVRAGQTAARGCLQRIYADHGEGHVVAILRVFTDILNVDSAKIYSFTISA